MSNLYVNEQVASNYAYYFSGYRRPRSILDQIDILRGQWPTLKPDLAIRYARDVFSEFQLPNWVEGPFVVIRPGFFSNVYREELEEVMRSINCVRDGKFHNYKKGKLGTRFLWQSARTLAGMQKITQYQCGSDLLIVPAQLGIRHAGRSFRRAREVFTRSEFGTDAKNMGLMILTHPDRFRHSDDLFADCAGDEYAPGFVSGFSRVPYWFFGDDGRLGFSAYGFDGASSRCGSASIFLAR